MDKYAPYVWAAYGVALGLLTFTIAAVVVRLGRAQRRLKALERKDEDA